MERATIKARRTTKITYSIFSSVYKKRRVTNRDKMLRRVFVVEDIDGNFRIEEHPSLIGYISFVLFAFVALPIAFIYSGVGGIGDLASDVRSVIGRKPLRCDELYHDTDSTKELLNKIGWLK